MKPQPFFFRVQKLNYRKSLVMAKVVLGIKNKDFSFEHTLYIFTVRNHLYEAGVNNNVQFL
jgi:ribosomal protein S2